MRTLSLSFVFLAVRALAQGTVNYSLDLKHLSVNPDGFERLAVTLNGITPGPILTAEKGQNMLVQVNNLLGNRTMRVSTTIHWHGIFQPRVSYDDGPAFVTQCPIGPNQSYTYRIATSDQAGTFWYHGHLSLQYIDGLRGALIIYDPDDPHADLYDVDDESTVISLTDWYHSSAAQLGIDWIAGKIPEPIPDSNLLDGLGRYQGGPPKPRAVITVTQGKRYRFRLINMSAIVPFNFSIENHPVTIIEADSVSHQPLEVTSLSISAGQRYSFILNANQPSANYWIVYPSNFRVTLAPTVNPNYNGTEAFGILHYDSAPEGEDPLTPEFVPDNSNPLLEYNLKPLESPPPPTDTPLVVNLTFAPDNGGDIDTPGGGNLWRVNGIQYKPPSIPTLLEILTTNKTNQTGFPSADDVYVLSPNQTYDVRLIGDSHHPFHLHGHVFQIIQSAEGPRNEIDPPIRDTVNTNDETADGTPVTIRFLTDNPGPWFLHCHKDWHLEAGLAVVFAEDPAGIRSGPHSVVVTPEWNQLCKIYDSLPPEDQ